MQYQNGILMHQNGTRQWNFANPSTPVPASSQETLTLMAAAAHPRARRPATPLLIETWSKIEVFAQQSG